MKRSIGGGALSPFQNQVFLHHPEQNGFHRGSIQFFGTRNVKWVNKAGVKWSLQPIPDNEGKITAFRTQKDCCYNKPGNPCEELVVFRDDNTDEVIGLEILGEVYHNTSCQSKAVSSCKQCTGGHHGYVSMNFPGTGADLGFSMYTTLWKLRGELPVLKQMQIGLPGTWVTPDNRDFNHELCPPGTKAHEWKERGPYYKDVFQTIEGGPGFWCTTRFPTLYPKYRINGTPNGYTHEIPSPLFGFGNIEGLAPDKLGILQISNRVLIPPDGLTFCDFDSVARQIGNAWVSLPLLDTYTQRDGTPVGGNTWTLFLNTTNFKGPLACWVPDVWAKLSKEHPSIRERGLDSSPGLSGSIAIEVNTVPYFQEKDIFRVPKLFFPVDKHGDHNQSTLVSNVRSLSAEAIAVPFSKWASNPGQACFQLNKKGFRARAGNAQPFRLDVGPSSSRGAAKDLVETRCGGKEKDSFQLVWKTRGMPNSFFSLPSTFQRTGRDATPTDASSCSEALRSASFQPARPRSAELYRTRWRDRKAEELCAGPLKDGTILTYQWVRFVDQPAFAIREWNDSEKLRVQATIERLHKEISIEDAGVAPPGAQGRHFDLVALDKAIFVAPPPGKESGYVTIVVEQRLAPRERPTSIEGKASNLHEPTGTGGCCRIL